MTAAALLARREHPEQQGNHQFILKIDKKALFLIKSDMFEKNKYMLKIKKWITLKNCCVPEKIIGVLLKVKNII